ncbi:HAD family hydrolase [Leucobacter soli]|nr:HAD family phosphatase [Leucobacter soli]
MTARAPEPVLSAVLWDMDGTLIDSEPLWLEAEHRMLARYGVEMTPGIGEQLVGSGLWEAAELFRGLGVRMPADDIVAEWVEQVGRGMDEGRVTWRPGARELLASLGDAGVPSALVTMSVRSLAERTAAILPAGTFSAIVAGDEVTRPKPHPEPYLRGAAALDVPIESCLVIEDSPTGLRSAAASGAVAIGVTNLVDLAGAPAHDIRSTLVGLDAAGIRAEFARLRPLDRTDGPRAHDPRGR